MKTNKIFYVSALLFLAFSNFSFAEEPVIKIAVGQARTKKSIVAFPQLKIGNVSNDPEGLLRLVRDVATEDLSFSGLFDFLSPTAFIEDVSKAGTKLGSFKFTDWSSIGAEFLLKGEGKIEKGKINLEIYLYALQSGKQLFGKKYDAASTASRKLGHTLANDIMFALTGKKGPFTCKIAFVSDRTGKKEVYVMDYDGENIVKVTSRFSMAIAPAWSPDGTKIVFTGTAKNKANVRNHNLYEYTLKSGSINLLSNKPGLNSGATYSPGGNHIALTMSFPGNPELFFLDPVTKIAQRITTSFGMDVDPSFSPDGKQVAFVSDRAGRSMIYKMDANGANVQRLTFAGQYNATPSWSPLGNKIAFAGWDQGKFDIFIMNTDGSSMERLTKNMGNNEDPDFAPDGYFIVYSSNRMGKKNLYITNTDNTVHRRITTNFGNCEAPKWSPAQ